MKVRKENLSNKEKIITLDALYTAASSVKGREKVKMFLRDLLTESERIMLGRRILIARMLIEQYSYDEIQAELRVGRDTVSKVHRWILDQFPGYEQAIVEMKKEFRKRKSRAEIDQSLILRLKRKYPLHFLLFPTPKQTKKNK